MQIKYFFNWLVFCFFVVVFILTNFYFVHAIDSVIISEVMYNPNQCSDSYCEWIELFNPNNETINLSDCSLSDKSLNGYNIEPNSYLVAIRDHEYFDNYFFDGSNSSYNYIELSFSLKNSGEDIILEGNENCSDSFDYTNYAGEGLADGNNHTLERREDGTWSESLNEGGTPNEQNTIWSFSDDYSVLLISEVLPNPYGDDDENKPDGEWVELYNSGDQTIDLRGLMLTDQDYENELYISDTKVLVNSSSEDDSGSGASSYDPNTVISPNSYKVIYRDGDSDFALNNNGYEEIKLYYDNNLIDEMTYSGSTEGMSWSLFDDNWYLTLPTPESENDYTEGCDWMLDIYMENNIFQEDDFYFNLSAERIDGTSSNITIKGTIEDIYGEEIKYYSPWTDYEISSYVNKQYTPNLGEGVYQITFWYEDLQCSDYDISNNEVHSLFAINPKYKINESSLSIEKVYLGSDDTAEWGDQFTVKVNIYKGEETKYSIELWAEMGDETISKRTSFNIYEEYKNYTVTLPVQLIPNCDNGISDGTATLYLEGLDLEVTEEFDIEDIDEEVCTDYLDYVDSTESDSDSSSSESSYELIGYPETASPGETISLELQMLSDDEEHDYKVWAYVYRGSKCYSCYNSTVEREDNLQEFGLDENELKQTTFLIKLDDKMDDGDYKIKVKINKDDQATNTELTENITISSSLSSGDEEIESSEEDLETYSDGTDSDVSSSYTSLSSLSDEEVDQFEGIIVYESSSKKAQKLVPYLMIFCVLLLIVVVFKEKLW